MVPDIYILIKTRKKKPPILLQFSWFTIADVDSFQRQYKEIQYLAISAVRTSYANYLHGRTEWLPFYFYELDKHGSTVTAIKNSLYSSLQYQHIMNIQKDEDDYYIIHYSHDDIEDNVKRVFITVSEDWNTLIKIEKLKVWSEAVTCHLNGNPHHLVYDG